MIEGDFVVDVDQWPDVRRAAGPPGGINTGSSWLGGPSMMDAFGSKRAPTPNSLVEAYKSLIFALVQFNANAVCKIPLKLYADSSRGDKPREASMPRSIRRGHHAYLRTLGYLRSVGSKVDDVYEITNHPILDCLDSPDPNGYFDRQGIISLISRYCDIVGAAYFKPDGARNFFPTYLWPLASQYVVVVPDGTSPLIGSYRYFRDTYRPDELLRFRANISLRDPYKAGYSPTYAAIEYAGLEDQYVSIQTNLLSGGPRPNLVISAADPNMPMGEPVRRALEEDLDRKFARGNSGRALVTQGSIKVDPISYSPADLSGLDLSKYDMERSANVFGVPLPFLTGETNLANLQAAREQHAANAVEPRCKMIAATLTRLVAKYDDRLFFAFDPAVPEDEERKAKITQIRLTTGQTTINQENEETQYPPVAWGDEPWLSNSLVQPSMAMANHEMGLETQKSSMENETKATEIKGRESGKRDPKSGSGGGKRGLDGAEDTGVPEVHGGPGAVERRFDEILAAMEKALGL